MTSKWWHYSTCILTLAPAFRNKSVISISDLCASPVPNLDKARARLLGSDPLPKYFGVPKDNLGSIGPGLYHQLTAETATHPKIHNGPPAARSPFRQHQQPCQPFLAELDFRYEY